MNCKPSNSCCSPTQQWKEILLNTQDKAIQAYNLAQQALDEIENLPAGGGSVQSVNGELPDQDGNVTVDTGVMSVNGVSADEDGEFTIAGISGKNGVTVTSTTNGLSLSVGDHISTVNGVGSDTFGELTITQGNNITVTEDIPNHEITIASTATALRKTSLTITSAGWTNNQNTVTVTGLTTSDDVFVTPDPTYWSDWASSGIRAVSQGMGTLTFECDTTPTADIDVNLVIGRLNA